VIETETEDAIEEEILESVPKTMKTKVELLVWKMKADHSIAWSEKGELKYKVETVRGSNVVYLVNDVLRKRKYFNLQGWETFGESRPLSPFRSLRLGEVDTLHTTGLSL
jgi:hypothetical protein